MSLKESATINVGYPITGAKFINNITVMAIGGGGEGRNGIPNCITSIKCSFKVKDPKMRLQKFREITLPTNEDSPQCIDAVKVINDNGDKEYNVIFGCNQSTQLIRSMGINCNVRKYVVNSDQHMKFIDAAQFESELPGDADDYPRAVKLANDNFVGCFLTTTTPSSIYIFNPESLELKFKYKPERDMEIKDIGLSPADGKVLCYISSNSIETVSTSSGQLISSTTKNASLDKKLKGYILSKMKFINENEVLIGAGVRGGKGTAIVHFNIQSQKIIKIRKVSNKFNMIVGLDISHKQDLIGIAGNDYSLSILRLSTFNVIGRFEKLHPFAITSVSFSPDGTKLATGSAANFLHVFNIPKNYGKGSSVIGTLFEYLVSIILIAAFGIFLQRVHTRVQFDQLILNSKESFTLENTKDLAQVYGKKFMGAAVYLKDYGYKGIDFIKGKMQGENIDGDEETGKYFTMDEWDDGTTVAGTTTESTLMDRVTEVTKNIDEYTKQPDFDSETFLENKDNYIETSIIKAEPSSASSVEQDTMKRTTSVELSTSKELESSVELSVKPAEESSKIQSASASSVPVAVTPSARAEPKSVVGNDTSISSESIVESSTASVEKAAQPAWSVVKKEEQSISSVVEQKEQPISFIEKSEQPSSSVEKETEPSSSVQAKKETVQSFVPEKKETIQSTPSVSEKKETVPPTSTPSERKETVQPSSSPVISEKEKTATSAVEQKIEHSSEEIEHSPVYEEVPDEQDYYSEDEERAAEKQYQTEEETQEHEEEELPLVESRVPPAKVITEIHEKSDVQSNVETPSEQAAKTNVVKSLEKSQESTQSIEASSVVSSKPTQSTVQSQVDTAPTKPSSVNTAVKSESTVEQASVETAIPSKVDEEESAPERSTGVPVPVQKSTENSKPKSSPVVESKPPAQKEQLSSKIESSDTPKSTASAESSLTDALPPRGPRVRKSFSKRPKSTRPKNTTPEENDDKLVPEKDEL